MDEQTTPQDQQAGERSDARPIDEVMQALLGGEPESNDEDDADGESQDEATDETKGESDASKPATLRVGESDVPIDEAVAMVASHQSFLNELKAEGLFEGEVDLAVVSQAARDYASFVGALQTPEGFANALDSLLAAYVERHGEKVDEDVAISVRDLDPKTMVGTERRIYGALSAAVKQNAELRAANLKLQAEFDALNGEVKARSEEATWATELAKDFPGMDVSGKNVRALMAKHNTTNPRTALIAEQALSGRRGGAEPTKTPGRRPGDMPAPGNKGAVVDPKNLPVDELMRLVESGASIQD